MAKKKSDALDLHKSGRVIFSKISSHAWEHPTDRAALTSLEKIPGFDSLLRKFVGTFGEKNVNTLFTAAAVKVGPKQYPAIHEQLVRVCEVLDTDVPPLYISQTPIANAGAYGMDNPFIVLNSTLVELAKPEELEVVLGHEVGHVMSEHALYRTLLYMLVNFSRLVNPVTIMPITLALLEWSRKAEISCDRAGLLATQNLEHAQGMHCVLAGGVRDRRDEMSVEAFVEQAEEYRSRGGLAAYYRFMNTLGRSHDFPVIRVAELQNWVDDGDYAKILGGAYPKVGDAYSAAEDWKTAGKNFQASAEQVFEDTDKYVNEALTNFFTSARNIFQDRSD